MPAEFVVSRSATVAAPPSAVYPLVADFREWTRWSPWEGADAQMTRTYTGAASGEGAEYAWAGKGKAGAGSMRVTDADAPRSLDIDLQFTKPFKARNAVRFEFAEDAGGHTEVTWRMTGRKMLLMRLLGPLMNMDKAIGRDFETGLAQLKAVAEGGARG